MKKIIKCSLLTIVIIVLSFFLELYLFRQNECMNHLWYPLSAVYAFNVLYYTFFYSKNDKK